MLLPSVVQAYPDRAALQSEAVRLQRQLQEAHAGQSLLCAPETLAAAQTCLAAAMEELQEGDRWEAEDRLRECRKLADQLGERILACNEDTDLDGIPNHKDLCPQDPEIYNGYRDDDGCPDLMPERALLATDRIEILEPISFADGSPEPASSAQPVLREIARVLGENPRIRIRIEVHLDNTLAAEEALRLSRLRAESVKRRLEELGVGPDRLLALGKGNEEPIAPGDSAFGRQLNQRVEFVKIP